jgi:hypothetical protein
VIRGDTNHGGKASNNGEPSAEVFRKKALEVLDAL